ncbi:C3HC4 type (RING finger) zinc finger containing protein [Cladophialophora carrionii]|uniref:RING-type E3 ubiquitin transferase n=1 Tax=Cladophialophora carrionii TaxID=86049 RepID=A0A1C1CCW7_9EURO|nr:C3HC4 type (RING finger) zinc finger containing protein [Cladophialophora carrionii]
MSLNPLEDSRPAGQVQETMLRRSEPNEEEQNYCRICRGEGTVAQPLYYPCKCSGSIKFVHQECLMEWLSHSQKKYCELCKTSFRFTKLYDRSMPARLPFPLFVRKLARHGIREFARWTRYLLVAIIWTCCLPWCIRQVWRGFLWLADGSTPSHPSTETAAVAVSNTSATGSAVRASQTQFANVTVPDYLERITLVFPPMLISLGDVARVIVGQGFIGRIVGFILAIFIPRLRQVEGTGNGQDLADEAAAMSPRPPSLLSDVEFLSAWSGSRMVNNATLDIIEGQLICILLVTAFILVFLIREWVINQQPILNMPDPDAIDNPLQERQAENERPRVGLLRPRNRRQGGDANPPAEGGVMDPAARPIAIPRRRRALTDDNILNDTGIGIERPAPPVRSQSLLTSPDDIGQANVEEAAGESSAVADNTEGQPVRRRSSSSHHTTEDSSVTALGVQTMDAGNLDSSSIGAQGTLPLDFAFRGSEAVRLQPDSLQHMEPNERDLPEPLGRTVSFAQTPDVIDEIAIPPGHVDAHEIATDSDGQVIPTPDSSNDTDFLHPGGEFLDTDLQEDLFDSVPGIDAEELAVPIDQEPTADESLIGRISKWLWHTDVELDTPEVAEVRDSPHADTQDEEHIVEDVNVEAPFVPVHNREAPQIPQLPPAPEARPAEPREPNMFMGVDLNDAGDDAEDLDGVLELLGMEGPIFGMVQNVLFSFLLITITLTMSFWFPYMWGKIALLFLSQPTLMLVRAPLFVLSRSADIVVDVIFFVVGLTGFLFSQPMKLMRALISGLAPSLGRILDTATIEGFTLDLSQKSGTRLERTLAAAVLGLRPDVPNFSMQSHHALISLKSHLRKALHGTAFLVAQIEKALTSDRPSSGTILASFQQSLKSAPEVFKKLPRVRDLGSNFVNLLYHDLWTEPTQSVHDLDPSLAEWNNQDRILAIILGYALFAVAGVVFLEVAHLVLGLKDNEKVEGYFADSLRQAGGVMKVIVIIGIEMLVFPLYCGLLLDLALLPLFANATVASRVAFMTQTPLTGIFIHWFIGTCYMFHFALFVSICRKIMRKGVLYFIRDPDDPTFHPVRDVLERPVPAQLGKIAFSALVYGGLVTLCLGGVVWTLDWVGGVLPIRWSTPEPRLAFPIDIVFYNFLLPFILRKAEPSKKISAMYKWWFRGCARSLRLTNFLFGEERKDEQYTHPRGFPWRLFAHDGITEPQRDGTYVRAPASDSVRIAKGRNVFLEVTEQNERVDGRPDTDFGMHGKKDPQFTKVYLPPNFRSRITTFIALLWLFAAATGVTFTIGPLLVGRKLTQRLSQSQHPPNDLYAFTVGVHIFAAAGYAIAYARPARDYLAAKVTSSGKQILGSILHFLGLAYLSIFTTIVLPFVMALITELYIHMPLFDVLELVNQEKAQDTSASGSTSTPTDRKRLPGATIFILQSWTIGLLYLKLLLRVLTHATEPTSRPARALRAITRNGILHADVPLASRAFVLPTTMACLALLLCPLTFMKLVITVFRVHETEKQMRMYRFAYPLFLWMMVNYVGAMFMKTKVEKWRVMVRDEVYLLGERLHNFQEPKPRVRNVDASSSKGKGKAL